MAGWQVAWCLLSRRVCAPSHRRPLADGIAEVIVLMVYLQVSFMDLFRSIEILVLLRLQSRQIGFAVVFCPSGTASGSLHAANALLDPRVSLC